jgi:hypothetical protein
MARSIRVRINGAGAKALLTSAGVAADISARADAIAQSACAKTSPDEMRNAPYMSETDAGGTRARGRVWTSSPHGIRSNNKHNTLLNSIDAGR